MRKGVIAVLAGVALTLPACGGDSGSKTLAVTVSEPSAGKVTMAATGTVKAGQVTVTLKNNGKNSHDAQLIRVEGKHTADEVKKVVASESDPIPDWLHAEGGVGTVNPGQSGAATVVLTAGSYFVIDTNTDDKDKAYSDQGAIKAFTVKGDAGTAAVPAAEVTITAKEYSFGVPTLSAGSPTVKFENTGKEIHLLVAAPIAAGKTINDVRAAFNNQNSTAPPPIDFEKAVQLEAVDPGKAVVAKVDLVKGTYAFICFISDRAGGPPHFTKGMLQEVKIA